MWTRGTVHGFYFTHTRRGNRIYLLFFLFISIIFFLFSLSFLNFACSSFLSTNNFYLLGFFFTNGRIWLFIIVNIFIIYLLIHFIILNINQRKQVIILSIWNKMSTFNKCERRTFCTEIVDICTKLSYNNSCLHLKCLYPYI